MYILFVFLGSDRAASGITSYYPKGPVFVLLLWLVFTFERLHKEVQLIRHEREWWGMIGWEKPE